MIEIECADVMEWAKGYEGPKFHAVLCDPPYHLVSSARGQTPGSVSASKGVFARTKAGGFMGKAWDGDSYISFQPETWAALAQHLYPGAFLMAFGGSRTYHRLAVAMEDAGLVIHPTIGHVQSQGFPKATRIDTQVQPLLCYNCNGTGNKPSDEQVDCPVCEGRGQLRIWAGHRYGLQAMKPCLELVCVAQKPYIGRPVDSITETGAGALNIDRARVGTQDNLDGGAYAQDGTDRYDGYENWRFKRKGGAGEFQQPGGRWPPNFALSHIAPTEDSPGCVRVGERKVGSGTAVRRNIGVSGKGWKCIAYQDNKADMSYADPDGTETIPEYHCAPGCPIAALDAQAGTRTSGKMKPTQQRHATKGLGGYSNGFADAVTGTTYGDSGAASRFFPNFDYMYEKIEAASPTRYCPKSSRAERDAGLGEMPEHERRTMGRGLTGVSGDRSGRGGQQAPLAMGEAKIRNPHPTCKPLSLAKWLATLLLPPPEYAPPQTPDPLWWCSIRSYRGHPRWMGTHHPH